MPLTLLALSERQLASSLALPCCPVKQQCPLVAEQGMTGVSFILLDIPIPLTQPVRVSHKSSSPTLVSRQLGPRRHGQDCRLDPKDSGKPLVVLLPPCHLLPETSPHLLSPTTPHCPEHLHQACSGLPFLPFSQ